MEHVLSRAMGLGHLSVLSSQAARGCVFRATLQSHAALLVGRTAVQRGEFLAGCFSDASRVEPALCGFRNRRPRNFIELSRCIERVVGTLFGSGLARHR